MKIAFIGTRGVPATYSGFETCVEQVAYRLVQAGHDVEVYCRSGHYSEHKATYRGIRLRYRPAFPQKHLETLSHTALSAISLDRKVAVVCMGVGNAPVIRSLELSGRQCVFNVDGADWQRAKWGGFARWYLRTCERLAARGTSVLVADAETVKDYYRAEYGRDTELVTYGAQPPGDLGKDVLETFRLEADGYALFVGRLVPENGAHDFLDGMRQAGLADRAVVVGDDPFERGYVSALRASDASAIFTGYQYGCPYQQLTAHARVFVLAASVGGTHPVLLEQMAAGNCILARDTPSNREVLDEAGLFWRSPRDLSDLMNRVWSDADLRGRLGAKARERSGAGYSWDLVAKRYLDLCQSVLN